MKYHRGMPTFPNILFPWRILLLIVAGCFLPVAYAAEEPPAQPNLLQAIGSLFGSGQKQAEAEPAQRGGVSPENRNLSIGVTDKRVALVIGNSGYPASALENPRHDAAAMDAALQRLGFKVDTVIDGTKAQLDAAMKGLARRADSADVAAVFYAGHGIQVNGANYIVPIDAKPQSARDLKREMVKLDDIIDDMGQAKVKLVFFDACRDNPLARSFSRGGSRGLAPPNEVSGTLISFATKHGNTASDGEEKNSPYTQALIAELNNPAGVEIEALLKNVNRKVKAKTHGQQEPWKYGNLDADFYFIFQGPTTVNVQQAPADPETKTWEAAESANTAQSYRAYLDAYPKGRYVVAAKIKLDSLKTPAVVPPVKVAVLPAPTFVADDPETAFWNEVKTNGAREYFDAYVKQYPKGKYLAFAKLELKKIDDKEKTDKVREDAERKAAQARGEAERKQMAEREKQERIKAEQDQWESAKRENSSAAYTSYLSSYPNGPYGILALLAKEKAQQEEAEKARQDSIRKEQEAKAAAKLARQEEERRKQVAEQERYEAEERVRQEAARVAEAEHKAREEAARGPLWADSDNGENINWSEATRYCASKGSGWRLPTVAELQASYQSGRSTPCSWLTCKVSSNSRLTLATFWTNEQNGSSEAWYVGLVHGDRHADHVEHRNGFRALCVRRH